MRRGSVRGLRGLFRRRAVAAVALGLTVVASLGGCSPQTYAIDEPLQIAGGGTTGVYYAYGGQLADALHRELGVDISVAETHGSVDNLLRVASGEALLGFAQGDTAADAVNGAGAFEEPLPVEAV